MRPQRNKRTNFALAEQGFALGYGQGRRDGACQALAQTIQAIRQPSPVKRDVRVLYVPQGFQSIDQGIIEALKLAVRELHVADPKQMAEQASQLRPDWMLVLNGLHVFPPDHLQQVDVVRSLGVRTAIWFVDDPYVTEETVHVAPRYDAVMTHELGTLQLYRDLGCSSVHYMPLAVHPGLFRPMHVDDQYRSDVCFIGQGFHNRIETFDAIAPFLASRRVFIAGDLWDRLKRHSLMKRFIRPGWLPVEESIRYYNGAKIVVNLHRTAAAGVDNRNTHGLPGRSINPRTYEIAACGTLQLTDMREDLPLYYRPGAEVATFASPQELQAKLDHYLTHEEERLNIALRGLRRTLTEHTYASRMDRLAAALGW